METTQTLPININSVMFLDIHFIIFPMRTGNELFLAYNFFVKYSD